MSGGPWRRRRPANRNAAWTPPSGWTQVAPCVWHPPGYTPDAWELPSPPCGTREQQRAEFVKCEANVAYFAFTYCWTVHVDDPSGEPQYRKIPAYPYLRDLFVRASPPRNMHVEKSRQMLTSWAWMAVFLHDITFRDRWPTLVLSRRAKEVDDGGEESTFDSLLGKLRFMHAHLPPFLWFRFEYKLFLVSNRARGSYVKGETGKAGGVARGPAYRRLLKDEAAYVPHSESVHKGARQACKAGYIMNSTPDGKGNAFARIRFSTTTTFEKITLHWTLHPDKAAGLYCTCGWRSDLKKAGAPLEQFRRHPCANAKKDPPRGPEPRSPWYDRQAADLTPEQVGSELDISYSKSRRGRVFEAFDSIVHTFDHTQLVDPRTRQPIGDPKVGEEPHQYRLRYLLAALNPKQPLCITWDFGVSDPTAVLLGQVDDASLSIRWLDEIEGSNHSYDHYHAIIARTWYVAWLWANGYTQAALVKWAEAHDLLETWRRERRPAPVPDLIDERPPRVLPIWHAGDPTGKNRDSSLRSWITNLRGARPSMRVHYVEHKTADDIGSLLEWIDWCRVAVRERRVSVSTYCAGLIDAYEQWHWPVDKDTGEPLQGAHLPVHDEWSHKMMAALYLARTRWHDRLPDRAGTRATSDQVLDLAERAATAKPRRRRPEVDDEIDEDALATSSRF